MSTNSNIRIKRTDGTTTGIYCHWDGYIEGAGVTLQLAFNTAEKVEKLLKLGDLSSLRYYTEPKAGEQHDFQNPQADVCVAYHRDRGEEFRQSLQDEEFIYTFDEAEACWYVTKEEYVEKTVAIKALELDYYVSKKTNLLLDEIIKMRSVLDGAGWRSDEFAEAGKVVDTCIEKAREARREIIEKNKAEYMAYYEAYCN